MVTSLHDVITYTSSVDLTTGTSETTTYALPKEGAVDVNSGGQDALDLGKDSTTSSNTKTLNVEVLKDQQQQLTQEEARKKADNLVALVQDVSPFPYNVGAALFRINEPFMESLAQGYENPRPEETPCPLDSPHNRYVFGQPDK